MSYNNKDINKQKEKYEYTKNTANSIPKRYNIRYGFNIIL